ncbi:Sec1 family protein (macronuclear) [Tetrahymena thermophila SB210]|uniref:Sec1 family protein n=1 Tax=Tetrahymena thermophila (strain SB210) TaxID=312017 RepID=Q22Y69_TETTS|nr:Sec1 family protein [Tetrahymena thermophila SB210]EAR90155.2 Sec1 family protein [Tetrahymena thermophila SB210]|eukprot:XP_001010400.2 Sec1 family protein [Tetrahymena thermophila SB210]
MDNFFSKIVDNIPKFDIFQLGGDDQLEYQFQEFGENEGYDQENQNLEREKNFDEEIYITHLKQKLVDVFKQDEGKKLLLMDKRLHQIFDMIIRAKRIGESKQTGFKDFLSETGIDKISYLVQDSVGEGHERIYFFIYPDLNLIQKIKTIILVDQQKEVKRKYTCIMVPRISTICQQNLYGVEANITLKSFNFDLIPFGQDLFSLEIQNPLQQIYFEKEQSVFQLIADSLLRIQYLYGQTNNIFGIGNAAKAVEQVLNQKKKQHIIQGDLADYKTLESIIIIDRTADLATPLYTPITYQALLDEQFGITMNSINIKQSLVDETVKDDTQKIQIFLNPNSDQIFASISNQTLNVARELLDVKRKEFKIILNKYIENNGFNGLSQDEQDQVKKILKDEDMKKIEQHTYLLTHLMQAQQYDRHFELETSILFPLDPNDISDVVERLECLILFEYPIEEVLRLFCLMCQVQNGLKEKVFDQLRKLIIQQYGIEHLATLNRLEQLGFLKKYQNKQAKEDWNNLVAKLQLINEQVDETDPNDISYVYIAYAPISVRLVQQTFKKGQWREIERELKTLGNYFMPKDVNPKAGLKTNQKKLVVVYFIGGVSYGEVAALRLLGKLHYKEIVICTTNIINSKSIFKEAMSGFADL